MQLHEKFQSPAYHLWEFHFISQSYFEGVPYFKESAPPYCPHVHTVRLRPITPLISGAPMYVCPHALDNYVFSLLISLLEVRVGNILKFQSYRKLYYIGLGGHFIHIEISRLE